MTSGSTEEAEEPSRRYQAKGKKKGKKQKEQGLLTFEDPSPVCWAELSNLHHLITGGS